MTKNAVRKQNHNWQEKEQAVAIYMALHSPNDYKVGMFNIDQCAHYIGVRPSNMKVMVDNFKAFAGKSNLGTDCDKMRIAFEKYKDWPQERLLKLAENHIDYLWQLTRKELNVVRYIQAIGAGCFVDYYEILEKASKDYDKKNDYIDKLPHKWSLTGRAMRVAYSAYIFWCKKEQEALTIIANSRNTRKGMPETIAKAKELLKKF